MRRTASAVLDTPEAEEERASLTAALAREVVVGRAREELIAIEKTLQRRRWRVDPASWVRERLGEFIWSGQVKILQSVRDNRKTAAPTCHEVGKSFIAARTAAWWIDIHKPGEAGVITTAPTGRQVRAVLWKEIGRAQAKGLPGRTNQTEWHLKVPASDLPGGFKEEMVAFGFKPSDYNPDAVQGIHALHLLVITDETTGIPTSIIDAFETMIANDNGRFLNLGNPDDPTVEFAKMCAPGSGYSVIQIGAFDTPRFTGEDVPPSLLQHLIGRVYVEEKRKRWAPRHVWVDAAGRPATPADGRRVVAPPGVDPQDTHPFWQSKVLGLFPRKADAGGLISMALVRAAQERELVPGLPNELGVDVGGGGDSSTICHRLGFVFRIIREDHNPDTMQTCGNVLEARRATGATRTKIDKIGIGAGVVDRAHELGHEDVLGVNVGESPTCNCRKLRFPKEDHEDGRNPQGFTCNTLLFANLKAQNWWGVRELFELGQMDIDPEDEDLAAELQSIQYFRTSNGKIQIESKEAAKRRGVPSPNRAEALMLAASNAPEAVSAQRGAILW